MLAREMDEKTNGILDEDPHTELSHLGEDETMAKPYIIQPNSFQDTGISKITSFGWGKETPRTADTMVMRVTSNQPSWNMDNETS